MDNYHRALRLEYFTVGYNILEAAASIIAGAFAGSIALVGFGLDSIVESLSGGVLIWRLKNHDADDPEREETIEKRAILLVGITFFILSLYVFVEAIRKIMHAETAGPSLPGIIIAVLSIIIMPVLAFKKNKLGEEMGLESLVADSRETLACSILSVVLLAGLAARYLWNFTIADPIAGLVIAFFLVREGYELVFEQDED